VTTTTTVLLVAGAVVLGLAVRIARWPVTDRIVNDVIASVRQSSGSNPSRETMRDHIRKQRQQWGMYVGVVGVALIAIALLTI
jgi:hypothetical protein